ncbi:MULTISPECIES: type II secretion system protein [unclassified Caballeronia]|uniref:type II secretion system protein n=1 Tax=unclassified Caballeronia TaxID=2646786 RepID=UPI00286452DF|nr:MULTISPECIES: type II secretion system protein [unclassified Caballeronia]MDR5776876.1 type II secretion system protein [Caballeronia sp. LZ002]MDR5798818.1 type II secretion system protein [Caballeronia sp. LZ001]MDR5852339.1 type II secretion system protein [Caballeronia sp. LZ003]
MFNSFVKTLPVRQQLAIARVRFQKVREDFYRETRLDIAAKGLRNTETLFDRLETYEKRGRSRGRVEWQVFARIRETMQRGESFAIAIKPFIPGDEYALLDIADESSREDAVVRGFELAEMAAKAKRVLSATTSVQMAYPALLLVYMYAFCMLFGGVIFPQVLDVRPLEQWPDFGQLLYHVDTFCFEYWWLTLTVLIGLVLAYFASLKRWAGPLRDRFDRMPLLWRNRRDLRAALLIVSLAGLFDSNLTLRASLERLMKTADPWLRWHLSTMNRRLTARADDPMRALDTGIFSITIVDTVTDAAGRDQFEAAIKSLGRESLDRVVEAVKRNARLTHYILLGFAAALFLTLGIGSYVVTGAVNLTSSNSAVSSY